MRSYNEAWAIRDTLVALASQDYAGEVELLVIDSGSDDGSQEIIESFSPATFHQIPKGTYVPGVVLNWGIRHASHEWVVFLNADACPANEHWLKALLLAACESPKLGAAFSKQVPRDDCDAVFAHDYERCFGPNRESKNWDHFFSMVSCVTLKSIWEQIPIREDLQYAEDDEWTRRLKKAGYDLVFAEESIAIHSHNYTPDQVYKRSKGDAMAVAQAGNGPRDNPGFFREVLIPMIKDLIRDAVYFQKNGQLEQLASAVNIRYRQRLGRLHGFLEGSRDG